MDHPIDSELILRAIIEFFPGHVYWKDKEGRYLGCNQAHVVNLNLNTIDEIVGRTDYDLPWPEGSADQFTANDKTVISSGQVLISEEVAVMRGRETPVLSQKFPLKDAKGEIIGVGGISIDISDRVEKEECLGLENKLNKEIIRQQEGFKKISQQVAHDIRSPLATLLMIIKLCSDIPEEERVALREVAQRIEGIANNLLTQYKINHEYPSYLASSDNTLVYNALLQSIAHKKYQYKDYPIKFEFKAENGSCFTFINLAPTTFARMISNLINNAVEARANRRLEIKILLKLNNDNSIKIIIQDNGKGMTPDILDKIRCHIQLSAGKENGHGIGLSQVHDALELIQGSLKIDSEVDVGTVIALDLPKASLPAWIVNQIVISADDIIIILDDDPSIHAAWDMRFKPLLKTHPKLQMLHFSLAVDAINYIDEINNKFNSLKNILLLSDYELLGQHLNGLQVIKNSKVERAFLVTSYYSDPIIQEKSLKIGTKILPKELASEVPISVGFNV